MKSIHEKLIRVEVSTKPPTAFTNTDTGETKLVPKRYTIIVTCGKHYYADIMLKYSKKNVVNSVFRSIEAFVRLGACNKTDPLEFKVNYLKETM